MAYKILKILISSNSRSRKELQNMADVYYAAKRLTDDQYIEITDKLNQKNIDDCETR